jgi:hypothetical protein
MNLKLIFGSGEIKRIDSQIRQAFNIINGKELFEVKHNKSIISKIRKLGFDIEKSSGISFIGNRQIIKCSLITRRPPPIKYRVPTLIYSYDDPYWKWDYLLLIQPKVDITDDSISRTRFRGLVNCDIHCGNIGIYKGESVLFDW